jgi:hypothetical protein
MGSDMHEMELLQLQMRQVRTDLDEEVHDLVQNARTAVDWRHYWRSYPWVGCAAALTVGYLLVPARRNSSHDARLLSEVAHSAEAASRPSGARRLLAELGGVVLGLAARQGMRFVGRQVEQVLAAHAHDPGQFRNPTGSPANDHEQ